MSKSTPTAKPTGKATAPQPAAPAAAAELPMPTQGGCYIRLPDGSLVPDTTDTTEPAAAPAQEQAP